MSSPYYTIRWNGDSVSILDQRLLPGREQYEDFSDYRSVAQAIRDMMLRGAPLIGIAAGYGIALAAKKFSGKPAHFTDEMLSVCDDFAKTRPTAVNLFRAIDRMKSVITSKKDQDETILLLEKEAQEMFDEDFESNKKMGKNGSRFLSDGDTVLTHCNAGALATAGYGTALGVIRAAAEEGKNLKVFCCETRPYLQGARLTAWELARDGFDVTLICDNMAAHCAKSGKIQKMIVGADRIAANGDTANKIGTYSHSVIAKEHGIPFYVAAPLATCDMETKTGADIVIEERPVMELAEIHGKMIAPEGIRVYNPSFDVTPAENITAIITEKGVVEQPRQKGISPLFRD
jgi:methylthioribose-1-phosphate isomerase